jgi:NAD(P)-dependent dehydrogenase (short-subunit alcohol dehydrogenase family)
VQMIALRPGLIRDLAEKVLQLVRSERLKPLRTQSFCITAAAEALRSMSQAKHTGKLVLTIPEETIKVRRMADPPLKKIKINGTYIVTGGSRGFGFETAKWLAAKGAKNLVLISRSGELPPEVQTEIDRLQLGGVKVHVLGCDVANLVECRRALETIRQTLPPIRGVFHAAMRISDALISRIDCKDIDVVLSPKVQGTLNLHELTHNDPIDFFVCYSSLVAIFGNAGQALYSAANAFMDTFAAFRRHEGLPVLTINLGMLEDAGYLARNSSFRQHFEQQGFSGIPLRKVLEAVGHLLNRGETRCMMADIDWRQFSRSVPGICARPKFFESHQAYVLKHTAGESLKEQLKSLTGEKRRSILREKLHAMTAELLHLNASLIMETTPLAHFGLDSLAALEFRTQIYNECSIDLADGDLASDATIASITELILGKYESELPRAPRVELCMKA